MFLSGFYKGIWVLHFVSHRHTADTRTQNNDTRHVHLLECVLTIALNHSEIRLEFRLPEIADRSFVS